MRHFIFAVVLPGVITLACIPRQIFVPDQQPNPAQTVRESPEAPLGEPSKSNPDTGSTKCGGMPLRVRFYDVGQALAALVELPDGRRLLVDTGESPTRPGCSPCKEWHQRLLTALERDVPDGKLHAIWITHQHSDHHGGAPAVLDNFQVEMLIDNGTALTKAGVARARDTAAKKGTAVHSVEPTHPQAPLLSSAEVKIAAIVPKEWPADCNSNPNECSIGLRIEYCASSILFTGDAEEHAEAAWDVGPVTLLQVGHHGSDTSTTHTFVERIRPKYAVISSGKRNEGTNATYCHPRKSTLQRLNDALGGATGPRAVEAFNASVKCKGAPPETWEVVRLNEALFLTALDGDVILETTGDGHFAPLQRTLTSGLVPRADGLAGAHCSHPRTTWVQ